MSLLQETISAIAPLDAAAMEKARQRVDSLIKPPGSLGRLEELAVQLAGITGSLRPPVQNKVIVLMAGDHGVVEEGVSIAPPEVTYQMLGAFAGGVAGVSVFSQVVGARLVIVDVGVKVPVDIPGVLSLKVKSGTDNIARGPAMSREEAVAALEVGIRVTGEQVAAGADVLALGDMGIGNTTPSSAILACLAGLTAAEATGRGTFVNDEVLARKIAAVDSALRVNRPDPADGLDVLARVGGLEIGGLAGVVLAAAAHRKPVLVDGFISTAAAMIAATLAPACRDYLIPAHLSGEQGHRLMLEHLGLKPLLQLDMRLGEGTGAALAMPLLEAAVGMLTRMASFQDAGVSDVDRDKAAELS
ncbi:MAG: nicotinate-nucleotide--dimethylbenzimidazole phosphoribosyltransferase [Desulfurispora sp.]|uniref:nicotinate-nucleotide--dimethylbenzimidazole phosphoribosyltransferase n=1 Tax=Desulfurispora sp. TaxID=3014275 RepID=UPI00404A2E03